MNEFINLLYAISVFLGKIVAKQRKIGSSKTDERIRLMHELLTTIKIIKMYTWELFYTKRTNEERR